MKDTLYVTDTIFSMKLEIADTHTQTHKQNTNDTLMTEIYWTMHVITVEIKYIIIWLN